MIHTHTPSMRSVFSASSKAPLGMSFGGDIAFAIDHNVYLVPTRSSILSEMFLLRAHGMRYLGDHTSKVEAWGEKNKVPIPLSNP